MEKSKKKTDLTALKKLLTNLKNEATELGLPMARRRDIEDVMKVVELVEKKRQ
jgi:hypothetical protein